MKTIPKEEAVKEKIEEILRDVAEEPDDVGKSDTFTTYRAEILINDILALLSEQVAEAKREGFKQGFKDCKGMVERGEHKNCCIVPGKLKARDKLKSEIRKGTIKKGTVCEHSNKDFPCSVGYLHGHHYLGYEGEHWKDVMWLCARHHMFLHRKTYQRKILSEIEAEMGGE